MKSLTFTIAGTEEDYELAHGLMLAEGLSDQRLDFPTILAFEGDDLVGMLGTDLSDDMVVAGPLVLKAGKRRVVTYVKIGEFYEATLRALDIYSYVMSTEAGSTVAKAFAKYTPDNLPYAKEGERLFFIRKLDDGRQSQRTGT